MQIVIALRKRLCNTARTMSNQSSININIDNHSEACRQSEALIKPLIGRVVGKVRVFKPVPCEDRSFECAAWWEKREGQPGVYDVVIAQDLYDKNRIFLQARIPSVIVEDFFGSRIGAHYAPYDSKQNAGNPGRPVPVWIGIADGVERSEASGEGEDGLKWAIFPSEWQALRDICFVLFQQYVSYGLYAVNRLRNEADDEHLSRLSAVCHAGEKSHSHGEDAQRISRKIRFRAERQRYGGADYFAQNNPWVAEQQAA